MAQAPITVETLSLAVDQSIANTSHHLSALKRAHLVKSTRVGVFQLYSVASPEVGALVVSLQAVAHQHISALRDLTSQHMSTIDEMDALDGAELLARMKDEGAVLIDVRPENEFTAYHLPNSISIPFDELKAHIHKLPRDKCIVAYCRGPFCTFSAQAAARLRALGFDARRCEVNPLDQRQYP